VIPAELLRDPIAQRVLVARREGHQVRRCVRGCRTGRRGPAGRANAEQEQGSVHAKHSTLFRLGHRQPGLTLAPPSRFPPCRRPAARAPGTWPTTSYSALPSAAPLPASDPLPFPPASGGAVHDHA
jgi:hypothetical protein